ncbi:hypothetical protein J3E74DRAFT_286032 [Bipolaris maydis]|nr:hypothetical protein J3E73DRAFT_253681 [Bipolaris maydis]KAJ5065581.1 hypothetical protein J3E74DRAFT_286032 [Bipolaris maydis]
MWWQGMGYGSGRWREAQATTPLVYACVGMAPAPTAYLVPRLSTCTPTLADGLCIPAPPPDCNCEAAATWAGRGGRGQGEQHTCFNTAKSVAISGSDGLPFRANTAAAEHNVSPPETGPSWSMAIAQQRPMPLQHACPYRSSPAFFTTHHPRQTHTHTHTHTRTPPVLCLHPRTTGQTLSCGL